MHNSEKRCELTDLKGLGDLSIDAVSYLLFLGFRKNGTCTFYTEKLKLHQRNI